MTQEEDIVITWKKAFAIFLLLGILSLAFFVWVIIRVLMFFKVI